MATGRPLRVTGAPTAFRRTGCVMWSILFLVTLITTCSANAVTESLEVKFAGSCDFETEDLCGYVQGEQDDFDWRRRTGPTPSRETGPDFDHTLGVNGSGHYAYIEGTGVHAWNAAHLISASLAPLPTYCLHFFYHMYGEDTGQLSVKVVEDAQVENPERVWSMLREQGNVWLNASVDIPCVSGCKIVFEAQPGSGFWSDIAIDDVTVTNGSCFPGGFVTTASPQMTSTEQSTSTKAQTTHVLLPKATGSMTSPTLDYEIIEYQYDQHFITIILAVGLTFWSIVFGIIFILFCLCDKRPNGRRFDQHRRSNIDMELAEPVKLGLDTTRCTESGEHECEEIRETDGNPNEKTTLKPDMTSINVSDSSSIDSERYSIPVITTPKPSRGPSPPPCGYMNLQQDSFNNNAEYQPLDMAGIPA